MQDTVFAGVDVFLNTSSVCHELPPRQVLRMWTSENKLKLDILQPFICSNTSKSVDVILTKFLKSAPSSVFKPAKSLPPYLVPSFRKCLVHTDYVALFSEHKYTSSADSSHTTWGFEMAEQWNVWTRNSDCRQSANIVNKLFADNVCKEISSEILSIKFNYFVQIGQHGLLSLCEGLK
jgi:hypothetical protein